MQSRALRLHALSNLEVTLTHEYPKPRGFAAGPRKPSEDAAQFAVGTLCLSGSRAGVYELERRTTCLAADLRALQPIVSHDGYVHSGAGRDAVALGLRHQ